MSNLINPSDTCTFGNQPTNKNKPVNVHVYLHIHVHVTDSTKAHVYMWLKFTYTIPTVDNGIVGDAFCPQN